MNENIPTITKNGIDRLNLINVKIDKDLILLEKKLRLMTELKQDIHPIFEPIYSFFHRTKDEFNILKSNNAASIVEFENHEFSSTHQFNENIEKALNSITQRYDSLNLEMHKMVAFYSEVDLKETIYVLNQNHDKQEQEAIAQSQTFYGKIKSLRSLFSSPNNKHDVTIK